MNSNEEVPTAPVTGWTVAPISAMGAVVIQFNYLVHATQGIEEANKSPLFLLALAQCRELQEKLKTLVEYLDTGPPPGIGMPKH